MKLTVLLLTAACLNVVAKGVAQKVTFSGENVSLEEVFSVVKKQTGYFFLYPENTLTGLKPVTVRANDLPLRQFLDEIFKDQPVWYVIESKTINLYSAGSALPGDKPFLSPHIPAGSLPASPQPVTGKVVDSLGNPIYGASIRLLPGSKGTSSNSDGSFTIPNVSPGNYILEISLIGHQIINKKITVPETAPLSAGIFTLRVAVDDLDELSITVSTGYQSIPKERATGAFAIVSNNTLQKRITHNATAALAGQVAGLTTYKDNIIIRGRSSISVSNSPLIVIDGMPTEYNLDDINLYDVENITVLMDAAATSIYGARAANGVIVLVTKKGEKGKTKIDSRVDWQWNPNPSWDSYRQAPTSVYVDWEQRLLEYNAKVNNQSVYDYISTSRTPINAATSSYHSPLYNLNYSLGNGDITQHQFDAAIDDMKKNNYYQEYMDLMWRTPFRQSYDVSVSNASDRQNTRLSFNYTGNSLQMKTNSDRTIQGYFSTEQRIASWLSLNLNVTAQYYKQSSSLDDNFSLGAFMGSNGMEPYRRIVDDNGERVQIPYYSRMALNPLILEGVNGIPAYDSFNSNVLDEIGKYDNQTSRLRLRNVLGLKFDITKDLSFDTKFSYEITRSSAQNIWYPDSYLMRERRDLFISSPSAGVYVKNIPDGGRLNQSSGGSNNYTFRNQLNYATAVAPGHDISVVGGFEIRENETPMGTSTLYYGYDPKTLAVATLDNHRLSSTGTGNGVVSYLKNSTQRVTELAYSNPSYVLHRFMSFYATAGYSYKRRYSVSGNFRIDQADLFGTDPKYRYRPLWSVGALWNASNEAFMESTKDWLDRLSLKASYGVTGNVDQNSSPYVLANGGTNQTYGDPVKYTTISTAPNPTLRWERTSSYNTTLDFSIRKGLLSGQLSTYYRYSNDLLVSKPTPYYTGFTTATVNNGAMSNKGVEIGLRSVWLNRGGWRLTSSGLISYNKNNVEKSFNIPSSAANYMTSSYYMEGYPRYAMYAYHYTGLTSGGSDEYNGIPQYALRDGTPIVTVDPNTGKVTYISSSSVKPEEAIYMGSVDPVWNGSFTQEVRFKNWELSAMLLFYTGHVMRNPYTFEYQLAGATGVFRNGGSNGLSKDIADSWSPDNTKGTLPKTNIYYANGNGNVFAYVMDYWKYADVNVLKADMVKLSNLTLSYSLPERYTKAAHMRSLRIAGQVNNPWMWSAAGKEIDPETGGYPAPPMCLLRLEIGF